MFISEMQWRFLIKQSKHIAKMDTPKWNHSVIQSSPTQCLIFFNFFIINTDLSYNNVVPEVDGTDLFMERFSSDTNLCISFLCQYYHSTPWVERDLKPHLVLVMGRFGMHEIGQGQLLKIMYPSYKAQFSVLSSSKCYLIL